MALNKKDYETINTIMRTVVKEELTPLQKEVNELKKAINTLSKDNAKVETAKPAKTSKTSTSKTSKKSTKLSPVGVSKKASDKVIQFVTNKAEKSIAWKSWIDHDEQFKPMDSVAQKYKATRKGKKYTFSSRENALAFYEELKVLFPKATFERA